MSAVENFNAVLSGMFVTMHANPAMEERIDWLSTCTAYRIHDLCNNITNDIISAMNAMTNSPVDTLSPHNLSVSFEGC